MLLASSYYFYINWEPAYALLLLTSTVVTYLAALGIGRFEERHKKKICLVSSLVLNLAILFLFKYYNFLASNVEVVLQGSGLGIELPEFGLLLPVGISFYTFQALGYSIDVYRGTTKVERDFPTYALFVSFFPQLVAGPIERSNNLLPQFREKHRFDYEQVMAGVRLMLWGYFMKLVLADRCGLYVDTIFNNVDKHNGGSYLVASLLFPFQIYGDFAGYSLIAIGVARILGFRLMENFHRPYFACTVGEFWHRWHISLSTWFRDYVYIPMGGSRVKFGRWAFNIMVVFVLSGIWHGAAWTFLLWGFAHGLLHIVEKALRNRLPLKEPKSKWLKASIDAFCVVKTFVLVTLFWVMFRATDFEHLKTIFVTAFTNFDGGIQMTVRPKMWIYLALFILSDVVLRNTRFDRWCDGKPFVVRWLIYAVLLFLVLGRACVNNFPFIYFQF